MAQSEIKTQSEIMLALGKIPSVKIFRNHTGKVQDVRGFWHSFGLCVGSADLVGWKTIEITPDMVGSKVAVFLSVEIKNKSGRVKPEQVNWMERVKQAGGIAGIARDIEEAKKIVDGGKL